MAGLRGMRCLNMLRTLPRIRPSQRVLPVRSSSSEAPARIRVAPAGSSGRSSGTDEVPLIAKVLGFAGLAPFLWYAPQHQPMSDVSPPPFDATVKRLLHPSIHALDVFISDNQSVVRSRFLSYAGNILTFMGAVHWGLAMAATPTTPGPLPSRLVAAYTLSVLPALASWLALSMDATQSSAPYTVMAAGFVGVYLYDEYLLQQRQVARWYTYLRTPLTFVVVGAISVAAYIGKERRGV